MSGNEENEARDAAATSPAGADATQPAAGRLPRWLSRMCHYRFRTQWHVAGTVDEVAAVFLDTTSLQRWWPQFVEVEIVEPGEEHGLGRVFDISAKGWAPYTLYLRFRVTRVRYPAHFVVDVSGDLDGQGSGSLSQSGSRVRIDFRLEVRVGGRLLQVLSVVLKPVLVVHHYWTMARGERGLRRELTLRRVQSDGAV